MLRSLCVPLLVILALCGLTAFSGCDLFGYQDGDSRDRSHFTGVLTDADGNTTTLTGTATYSIVRLQGDGADQTITVIQVALRDTVRSFTPVIEVTLPRAISKGGEFTARFSEDRNQQRYIYAPDGLCRPVLEAEAGTLVVDQKDVDYLEASFDVDLVTRSPYTPDPVFGCGNTEPIVSDPPVHLALKGTLAAPRSR